MVKKSIKKSPLSSQFKIGIIGLGPKGLYALERLLAQIKSKDITNPIAIHIYNQNQFFGAGNVYRNDQPSYLIMNYANKNIDIWSNELPIAILGDTPNFTKWLAEKTGTSIESLANGFAPRAMVGNYLMEFFNCLCTNAPFNVEIIKHVATIQNITKSNGQFYLYTEDFKKVAIPFDKLMFTTGHLGSGAQFDNENPSSTYVEFIYPIPKKLKSIEANTSVAIKGFGLTCIDAILSLTEGRGGFFHINADSSLSYNLSGNEPHKIYPFSRTGLPMIPRGIDYDDKSPLYYISEEKIATLLEKLSLSFKTDIEPLIFKEFEFNYYKVLFKKYQCDLQFDSDYKKFRRQITQFHETFSFETKFTWDLFINPFPRKRKLSHLEIISYTNSLISEAEIGANHSSFMAAASAWRKISPVFNKLYSFAGLDADSHRLFDTLYFGIFNRIAYGPPVKNMKKIVALAEAGIVDFRHIQSPKVQKYTDDGIDKFSIGDAQTEMIVDFLINARIPRNESKNHSSLYANLTKEGVFRYYTNTKNGNYKPGCIAIDFKGRPYDNRGIIQENITLYGTPTEGVTFDNDTLSRNRNNFASQWAHDIAVLLEKKQDIRKHNNEKKFTVQ